MGAIEWSDYEEMRNSLYRKDNAKEEIKALGDLPSKVQLKAVCQGLEDWWESQTATVKGIIDTNYEQTTTASLAKKIFKVFVDWKLRNI